jgi:hypothetical protein
MLRLSLIALLLLATASSAAVAQSGLSADLTASSGTGRGGDYRVRDMGGPRLALAWRQTVSTSSIALLAEVSADALVGSRTVTLECQITSQGCRRDFPMFIGTTAAVGVQWAPAAPIELRVSAGVGSYTADHERAIAALGEVTVAAFVIPHLGVVVGGRYIAFPSFRSEGLSEAPLTFGVRLR